jgi:hypothetical protein
MSINTSFGKLGLKLEKQLQFKCGLQQNILKSYTCKWGKPIDECGESATQYKESEKCIISFSSKNWDRVLQHLCDDMSAVHDPPVISVVCDESF